MIFRNRKSPHGRASPFGATGSLSGHPPKQSRIGPGVTVTGDLYSRSDIEVHGKVEGSVLCRNLTLGEEPDVLGEITTESVRICGRFNGNIRARRVVLTRTAVVTGEIAHSSLEVEPGAEVQGVVKSLGPDAFPQLAFDEEGTDGDLQEPKDQRDSGKADPGAGQ